MSWPEFKKWLRPRTLLANLLHYDVIQFRVGRGDAFSYPFYMAFILRCLARGQVLIRSDEFVERINLVAVLRQAAVFLRDMLRRPRLVARVRGDVGRLAQVPTSSSLTLNLAHPVLYLRTDLLVGPVSGGSVGHIAGVLNNLGSFGPRPVFVTTEYIETVNPDLEMHRIQFPRDFRDFHNAWELCSTFTVENQARQFMGNRQPSFIYQRYSLNNYTGLRLAQAYKVPLVLEYNGSEIWIGRYWKTTKMVHEDLALQIESLNLHSANLVVVVSNPSKEELLERGVDAAKILVNPNGVDAERFHPEADGSEIRDRYALDGKVVISFIGTFDAWHGAEVLADAFGQLLSQYPDYRDIVRLLLIGDGIRMPEVRARLERHGVAKYAVLTGLIPQAQGPAHLAAADILVSPHVPNPDGSKFFGSPTKLFEYMAMGRGIVASDLEQIGEVLEHGRTAWMVQPGNPQELAAGIKHLIDNEELRRQLGLAARREVVERYTWREHTRKIVEKLREISP